METPTGRAALLGTEHGKQAALVWIASATDVDLRDLPVWRVLEIPTCPKVPEQPEPTDEGVAYTDAFTAAVESTIRQAVQAI